MDGMHTMVPSHEYDRLCRVEELFEELQEKGMAGEYLMLPKGSDGQWTVDCKCFEHGGKLYETTGIHYSLAYQEWHVEGLDEDGEHDFPMGDCKPMVGDPVDAPIRMALERMLRDIDIDPEYCEPEIRSCIDELRCLL